MTEQSKIIDIQNLPFEDVMKFFETLKNGDVAFLPVRYLTPTQNPDGKLPRSLGPIEACLDEINGQKKMLVIHGNHRYYQIFKQTINADVNPLIDVRKVKNPFFDY